jgi:hypothetical protein
VLPLQQKKDIIPHYNENLAISKFQKFTFFNAILGASQAAAPMFGRIVPLDVVTQRVGRG